MNDVTFLLDETMENLSKLHHHEKRALSVEGGGATEASDDQNDEDVSRYEQAFRSCLMLAHQSLHLLVDFTGGFGMQQHHLMLHFIRGPFVVKELGDRLAACLLLNMRTLTGPKCRELRVKRAGVASLFQPRQLVWLLSQLAINMSSDASSSSSIDASASEAFLCGLARDQRSWTPELLPRVSQVLAGSLRTLHRDTAPPLMALSERVSRLRSSLGIPTGTTAAAASLSPLDDEEEIPEDLLDPLTFTLMTDPVRLRTSRQVLDRATLKAHLLNNPTDPFNRAPLVWERDVEEAEDVCQRIQAWHLQQRQQSDSK